MATDTGRGGPAFFQLAGHPLRWRLLSELSRSDLRVGELCAVVEEPQNLVSYHLRQLREGGVVRSRRSTADGRDTYYALDLAVCRDLLSSTATALHPGLAPPAPGPRGPGRDGARVLFLCTGNSGRSQIAEALMEHLSGGAVAAASAGSDPKPLHPSAVRAMAARGVDISDRRSKHLATLAGERFDHVVTLCDRVREVCPDFRGGPEAIHWSLPDPAREPGEPDAVFERTARELEARIGFLLAHIEEHSS